MRTLQVAAVMLFVLVLLALGNAQAGNGTSINWEQELTRPETQKAISQFMERHCTIIARPTYGSYEAPVTFNNLYANVHCWVDAPPTKP